MALLIGLKSVEGGGTFHGVEGLEGFNISATQFDILKEGIKSELVDFVDSARDEAEKAKKKIGKLEDKLEDCSDLFYEKYNKEIDDLIPKTKILKYSKLMIIEGFTL